MRIHFALFLVLLRLGGLLCGSFSLSKWFIYLMAALCGGGGGGDDDGEREIRFACLIALLRARVLFPGHAAFLWRSLVWAAASALADRSPSIATIAFRLIDARRDMTLY
jgi:hypothetical protein